MVIKKTSFTQRVKNELIFNTSKINEKQKIELLLLVSLSQDITFLSDLKILKINLENKNISNYFLKVYSHFYKLNKFKDWEKKQELEIALSSEFVDFLYSFDFKQTFLSINNLPLVAKVCFLIFGNINPPETNFYHLEFVFNSKNKAGLFLQATQKDFEAKLIKRRKLYVVYVKKAEHISNFLRTINATSSLLEFENVRIERDFLNSINRIHNMDLANLEKTIKASTEINSIIKKIYKKPSWNNLSEKEQKICLIRLNNPNFSLQDICDFYNKKYNDIISKSLVNHTFRKIKINWIYERQKQKHDYKKIW